MKFPNQIGPKVPVIVTLQLHEAMDKHLKPKKLERRGTIEMTVKQKGTLESVIEKIAKTIDEKEKLQMECFH